ncbi:cytochrome bd-type quinol oxidase, subunit 1 [Desulfosporosinus orientis DSM 765]|uniref:Cytochrome bd-type quinol oxidase, subunit 1 n=1 Tax=Desulfosporosinus orientis (strain ATCC 19365 / DSM 765 / NCIMB 8382 / VKM B-1628 / Singapore I) TaxID=768706 RepID=G7WDB7_DESOD|nr:cytochrome ubiquinol oxidase subunit I [Desulfosporosinus orientis]AET67602.1 cytochrome bd-type quinol oxidase, subunit 1 [Desulfosporosinus orientis DSM 765]
MTELILSRLQFAMTTFYHFMFVPLTLGLGVLVAMMETWYVKSGNETYKKMTKFWGKLFLINFAIGVVTGLTQEFQFGMNWSEYSRFVGDIFGAPLAMEALVAFFLESTFLGLWVFGWDKLSKKIHLTAIWIVAISSNISAFFILVANSFMQEPVGYALRNGRAEMTDFLAIITNPHVIYQFPHTVLSGFVTAAFFVMGVSAYHLLKKNHPDLFKRSFQIAVIFGLISTLGVAGIGHLQGMHLVKSQPMKMAAAEAHWETENPAGLSLYASIDEKEQKNNIEIKIPALLSFLSYNSFTGEVKGIHELQEAAVQEYGPGNYVPPVTSLFWSFRIMLTAGLWLVLMSVLGIYFYKTKAYEQKAWFLKLMLWTIPVPYIANTAGWFLAEVGRQPWIVYGLQQVDLGLSTSVSLVSMTIAFIGFLLVYLVLAIAEVYLMVKYIKKGPEEVNKEENLKGGVRGASLWT